MVFGSRLSAAYADHEPSYDGRLRIGATHAVQHSFDTPVDFKVNGTTIDFAIDYGLPGTPGPRFAIGLRGIVGANFSVDMLARMVSMGSIDQRNAGRDEIAHVDTALTWRLAPSDLACHRGHFVRGALMCLSGWLSRPARSAFTASTTARATFSASC
jgi:hypothetical protein